MSLSTILIAIFILIIDMIIIRLDIKNKLVYTGINIYRIIIPLTVVIFIILTVISKGFKYEDIIILIEVLPLGFFGNKCGITEKGLLINSYVTPWDKIENYSLEESRGKYILRYKTNIGERKISLKIEDKEEIKKYLLGIKKLKPVRK